MTGLKPTALAIIWLGIGWCYAAAAEDWPEFRGPDGQGHATATGLPLEWSAVKNVAWKQTVAGAGWSSPVVSGGQVFLTAGVPAAGGHSLRVLAFESATGRPLWNTEVFAPGEGGDRSMHGKNSPASATPVIEGERLYVHFGPHGTACLDRSGAILWRSKRLPYQSRARQRRLADSRR